MNDSQHAVRRSRRDAVALSPELIGLDHVVVTDSESIAARENRCWSLTLHFIPSFHPDKSPLPTRLAARNLRFTVGNVVDPTVRVLAIGPLSAGESAVPERTGTIRVRIETDEPQDDESWVVVLNLVDLPEVDRFFASATVRLMAAAEEAVVVPRAIPKTQRRRQPVLDFMAKDFESFRQLLLERMSFEVPRWKERSIADPGVTIVEVLAYAADYLSYFQDAAATEAYIDTARRRESVRRHARLIDYVLHEGSNARVWVQIEVERFDGLAPEAADSVGEVPGPTREQEAEPVAVEEEVVGVRLPQGTRLLTYCRHVPGALIGGTSQYRRARDQKPLEFHTMTAVDLFPEHNQIDIYTWGASDFSLPVGATSAILVGSLTSLRPGDVLIFECRRDPARVGDGTPDVRARQAVRLVACNLDRDPLTGVAVTQVQWLDGDSLEISLPVSTRVDNVVHSRLTIARGNVVLADHGATESQVLPQVPAEGRYRPGLGQAPLIYHEPIDEVLLRTLPAARALEQKPWEALPAISLIEEGGRADAVSDAASIRWSPRIDLLRSDLFDRHFVVETGDDHRVWLRFGNDENGHRPTAGTRFRAVFRRGQGPDGNVGVGAVRHVVLAADLEARIKAWGFRLVRASNRLPGVGGAPPEPTEHARITAPELVQRHGSEERCITAEDFAERALHNPDIANAVAELRFAGTGQTAIVYVERTHDRNIDRELVRRLEGELAACRMVGCEVEVRGPRDVSLDVMLTLWVDVRQSMARLNRSIQRSGGVLRLFDSGELTFGRSVYLSELVTRAMALPGIVDVDANVFRRWGEVGRGALDTGVIPIGRFEIARLDGDETRPQRGLLRVRFEKVPGGEETTSFATDSGFAAASWPGGEQ